MEEKKMRPRPRRGRRKVCKFCADKAAHIDYKNADELRKFTTERGKIMPRRMSGPAMVISPGLSSVPTRMQGSVGIPCPLPPASAASPEAMSS